MTWQEALHELRTAPPEDEFTRHRLLTALEDEIERLRGIIGRNKASFDALKEQVEVLRRDTALYKHRSEMYMQKVKDLELKDKALNPYGDMLGSLFGGGKK